MLPNSAIGTWVFPSHTVSLPPRQFQKIGKIFQQKNNVPEVLVATGSVPATRCVLEKGPTCSFPHCPPPSPTTRDPFPQCSVVAPPGRGSDLGYSERARGTPSEEGGLPPGGVGSGPVPPSREEQRKILTLKTAQKSRFCAFLFGESDIFPGAQRKAVFFLVPGGVPDPHPPVRRAPPTKPPLI